MPQVTSMTDGMKRLLRLCPNISLSNKQVKLIADGDINQVIYQYNENKIIDDIVKEIDHCTLNCEDATQSITSVPEIIYTQDVQPDNNILQERLDNKSFDEYFS